VKSGFFLKEVRVMLQNSFVYAVFEENKVAASVVERLRAAGFRSEQINLVGPDSKEFQYVSAKIKDPTKRNFTRFGVVGALAGLWAGTVLSPGSPATTYQIMTPLMGAISGSIVMAYFSMFLTAFLTANQPQCYANVYQADLPIGEALVAVDAESESGRIDAQKILEEFAPIELVVRRAVVGPVIGLELKSEPSANEDAKTTKAVSSINGSGTPSESGEISQGREKALSAVA
jgi:hypothetical protein